MHGKINGIAPGLYFQLFLDAFRGDRRKRLEEFCKSPINNLGICSGIVMHDFPKRRNLGGFSADPVKRAQEGIETIRASSLGKLAGMAYGLDGRTDGDGSSLTVEEKGERMGQAVAASRADLCLPNAETQYDSDLGPEDDMDESGALRMGARYRALAPTTVTIDQPWPMIDQHGENRRRPMPIGQGGSFAGFPIEEFGSWVDGRAPQVYWANWYRTWGKDAYKKVLDWSEREWKKVEDAMRALDPRLVKPRIATIQGYGHDAYPWTVVDFLAKSVMERPIVVWCDPAPTAGFMEIVIAAQRVVDEARRSSLPSGAEAIRAIQARAGLTVDGVIGPKTLAVIAPDLL